MDVFPANLARLRRQRGMSIYSLSKAAHVSPNLVSNVEQRRRRVDDDQKQRIADALKVTVADLDAVHDPDADTPAAALPAQDAAPAVDAAAQRYIEDPRRILWDALDQLRAAAAAAVRAAGNDPATVYTAAAEQAAIATDAIRQLDHNGKLQRKDNS